MGKQIDLTQKDIEDLTEEEIVKLEEVGIVERDKQGKPRLKNEIRTK